MNFFDAIKAGFVGYVDFHSRASRPEYWYWVLFGIIAGAVLGAIDVRLQVAFSLATLLPGLSLSVRRLHDIGRSGWWLLIAFAPLIGIVLLLIWACKRGEDGVNEYGPPRVRLVV